MRCVLRSVKRHTHMSVCFILRKEHRLLLKRINQKCRQLIKTRVSSWLQTHRHTPTSVFTKTHFEKHRSAKISSGPPKQKARKPLQPVDQVHGKGRGLQGRGFAFGV